MRAIKGSRILVLGIAYKKNVDDMRESPAVQIMEQLRDLGALIDYHDPHVPVFPKMREHRFDLRSVPLTAEMLGTYDAVLLTTDHARVDYALVREHARLIIDTRGVYREPYPNVVKA
jgi:UDP-N-acetyl-D-glucosamine dehydrogenase